MQTTNVKALPADYEIADGERLPLPVKDLGNSELYPQSLSHNPNGRLNAVCGDGEYIIYTALAWRNKSFGSAIEFAWSIDPSEFAVRESSSKIKLFKNFTEKNRSARTSPPKVCTVALCSVFAPWTSFASTIGMSAA